MSNTVKTNPQSSSSADPQINAVLVQLEKFGFKFFGHGENNDPLVIAPNGQIIPLKIAYEFVQQQIKKAADQNAGEKLESMPSIPSVLDSSPIEFNIEKSPEKESALEKKSENANNLQKAQGDASTKVPVVVAAKLEVKLPPPFDDGFKITRFDPTDLKQAEEYVNQKKKGSQGSTSTWLAILFGKFLQEYKSKNNS